MADEKTTVHVPTLISERFGISLYTANQHVAESILKLNDDPVPINSNADKFWVEINEDTRGKELTVEGRTQTYKIQLDEVEES